MYIYILKSTAQRFRYKIGISRNPKQRTKTVTEPSRLIFAVPLFFAAWWEKYLHRKYKHLNRRQKGNGGTEWFYFWLPFRPILWILGAFLVEFVVILKIVVEIFDNVG